MGTPEAIPNDQLIFAFNNIKTGDKISGYTAKSYNTNGTKTVSLTDTENNPLSVGTIRSLLKSANVNNNNLYMTGAKDTDPYQFKSPELMMNLIKYLNKN